MFCENKFYFNNKVGNQSSSLIKYAYILLVFNYSPTTGNASGDYDTLFFDIDNDNDVSITLLLLVCEEYAIHLDI